MTSNLWEIMDISECPSPVVLNNSPSLHTNNDVIQAVQFSSSYKANQYQHSNSLRSKLFHRQFNTGHNYKGGDDLEEMTINSDNVETQPPNAIEKNIEYHDNDNVFRISPFITDISPIIQNGRTPSCSSSSQSSTSKSQNNVSPCNKLYNGSPYSNYSITNSSKSRISHSSPSATQNISDSPIIFKTPARDSHAHPRTLKDSYVPTMKLGGDFNTPDSRIINPFEDGLCDKLNLPAFSPSTFTVLSTPSTDGRAPKPFCWSIDQMAALHPADIDEMPHHQEKYVSPDREMEERAQRAIDQYFSNHLIAPSPWNSSSKPFTLPCTPTAQMGYMLPINMDELKGSIQKELTKKRRTQDVSCQTVLTLPMDFDINKVLEQYMTHKQEDDAATEELSTSSLRRKLFFQGDANSSFSPVKLCSNEPYQRMQHDSPTVSTAKRQPTPEWERKTPLKTPSSTHFASSPINTNSSKKFPHLRRTSSAEAEFLASPELSPINRRHSGGQQIRKSRSSGEFAPMSSLCTSPIQESFSDQEFPPLPSPNMSPIRKELGASYLPDTEDCSDESTPHASNPRSYNSKASQFTLSPQFQTLDTVNGSPLLTEATAMETEAFKSSYPITDIRDFSFTDMETTNDTAPMPNSTNQDTGYQTASIQLTSLHTNLTSQFCSLPLKTETSIDLNSFNYSQSNPSSVLDLESEVSDSALNVEADSLLSEGRHLDKVKNALGIVSSLYPDSLDVSLNPVGSSTPTKGTHNPVKQKLFQRAIEEQDKQLGSEVASEILKRAGEDLAKYSALIEPTY